MPRQWWVPNRGKQTAAPLSFKRGTERERSFFIEKAHSARRFSPQGHCVRAPCPNKRRKDCVCHRVSNNEDADPHTILNALLVLAMIEKNCTLTRMHASNKPVSEDEEEDDVFSRRSLYYVAPVVTSWAVAGQRMVFLHMYLQTRVTLSAFPIVTPRGCSSKFPWRGTAEQAYNKPSVTIL